jgi:hypothetical protein
MGFRMIIFTNYQKRDWMSISMKGQIQMSSNELITKLERQMDDDQERYKRLEDDWHDADRESNDKLLEECSATQQQLWRQMAFLYCKSDIKKDLGGPENAEVKLDQLLKDGTEFGIEPEILDALKNFEHNEIVGHH